MAHHRDKESLLEEVWNLKKALQAAKESNRQLSLQNKHMVADLKVLEEAVIDLQAARKDQGSPSRSGAPAQQSALVARLKQQAREIKSQQAEIASELAQVKGSTRAHRFKEIEEENRALYAEIKHLTDALKGQKALFEKERAGWKRKVEVLEKKLAERRPFRKEAGRVTSPLEMVYTSGGGTLGNRREVSPIKSRERTSEIESIRSKCNDLQNSNEKLMQELHEIKEYVQTLGRASEPSQVRRQTLEPPGGRHFTSEESLLSEHSEVRTEVETKDEGNGWDSERMYLKQTLPLPNGRRCYTSEASNSRERFEERDVGREVVPSAVQPASDARAESSRRRAERNEQDKNPKGAGEPARTEVTQERAEVRTLLEHERNVLPSTGVQLADDARADPRTGTERNKQRQQPARTESIDETAEGELVLQKLCVGAFRVGGSDVGVKKKNAEAAETSGAADQGMTEKRARPEWALGVGRGEGKATERLRAGDRDVTERSAEREKERWAAPFWESEKEATAERVRAIDPQPDVRETEFTTRERDGDVKDRGTEKRVEWRPEAEPITEKARVLPEGEQETEKRVTTERKNGDRSLEMEGGLEAPFAFVRSEATPRKAIREGLSVTGIKLEERQAQPHLQVEGGASAFLPEAAKPNGSGLPLKAAEQRNAAVGSGAGPGPYERGPAVEVGRSKLEREWVSEGNQRLVDEAFAGADSRALEKEEKHSSETAHRTARSVVGASEKGTSIEIEGRRVHTPWDMSDSIRKAKGNARARLGGAADEKLPNFSDAVEEVLDEDTCHTGVQDSARALGFGVTTVVSDDIVEDVLKEESDFVVISSGSEIKDAPAPQLGVTESETEATDRGRLVLLEETQASETSGGLRSQGERSRLTAPSAFADVISADAERWGLVGASDGLAFSAPATGSEAASFWVKNSLEETSPVEGPERELGVNLRASTPKDARISPVDGRSKREELVAVKATPRDAGATLVERHSKAGDVSLDEILTQASATIVVDGGSNQAANEPPLPVKSSYERDELLEELELPLDDVEYADVQMGNEPSTRNVAAEVFEVQYEDPLARLDVADIDEVEDQW